jgi:hypothetical protein
MIRKINFILCYLLITLSAAGNICTKGDVKLDAGYAYIFEDSWEPICGHFFWDNNKGATGFCQKLTKNDNATGEVTKINSSDFDKKDVKRAKTARFIGWCNNPSDFPDNCLKKEHASMCNKPNRAHLTKIKCDGISVLDQKSCVTVEEKEIQQLYKTIRELEEKCSNVDNVNNKNEELKSQCVKMQKEVLLETAKCAALNIENRELRTQCNFLKDDKEEFMKYKISQKNLEEENKKKELELQEEMSGRQQNLIAELNKQCSNVNNLSNEKKELQSQCEIFQKEAEKCSALKNENQNLNTQCESLKAAIEELQKNQIFKETISHTVKWLNSKESLNDHRDTLISSIATVLRIPKNSVTISNSDPDINLSCSSVTYQITDTLINRDLLDRHADAIHNLLNKEILSSESSLIETLVLECCVCNERSPNVTCSACEKQICCHECIGEVMNDKLQKGSCPSCRQESTVPKELLTKIEQEFDAKKEVDEKAILAFETELDEIQKNASMKELDDEEDINPPFKVNSAQSTYSLKKSPIVQEEDYNKDVSAVETLIADYEKKLFSIEVYAANLIDDSEKEDEIMNRKKYEDPKNQEERDELLAIKNSIVDYKKSLVNELQNKLQDLNTLNEIVMKANTDLKKYRNTTKESEVQYRMEKLTSELYKPIIHRKIWIEQKLRAKEEKLIEDIKEISKSYLFFKTNKYIKDVELSQPRNNRLIDLQNHHTSINTKEKVLAEHQQHLLYLDQKKAEYEDILSMLPNNDKEQKKKYREKFEWVCKEIEEMEYMRPNNFDDKIY